MSVLHLSIVTVISIQYANGLSRIDPLVDTRLGLIRGLRASDGEYTMFLGIPYGKVNASNPFGPSTQYGEFDGVLEAYDDSSICPQIEEFNNTVTGSLDCLHLNVYVPNSATSNYRLPVLVWIYGGGFSIGFAGRYLYGPKFLVRHDIILVTVNYRLGPYGFMCLDTPEVPGNQGLKDQQLALRWIKDNIESFGGDPNMITIFGESAGAMAVDFHLIFNRENLFNKVIIQSGTTLTPTFYEPIRNAPILIADKLGFETEDINDAIGFLARVDTNLVIAAVNNLDLNLYFRPCVEKEYENIERFITENWIEAAIPQVRSMPVLIGFNENERLSNHVNDDFDYFANLDVLKQQLVKGFDVDNDEFENMQEIIKHFYFGDVEINEGSKWDVIDFESDYLYNHPTFRSIEKYLDNDSGNIYFYVFSYNGTRNFVKRRLNITDGGASHADEIGYLFDISYMTEEPTEEDQTVIDYITTMWANFVKYGDPTPETTDLLGIKWTPNTKDSSRHYLNLNANLSMGTRPFHSRMSFWDLFYKANWHLQRIYPGNV